MLACLTPRRQRNAAEACSQTSPPCPPSPPAERREKKMAEEAGSQPPPSMPAKRKGEKKSLAEEAGALSPPFARPAEAQKGRCNAGWRAHHRGRAGRGATRRKLTRARRGPRPRAPPAGRQRSATCAEGGRVELAFRSKNNASPPPTGRQRSATYRRWGRIAAIVMALRQHQISLHSSQVVLTIERWTRRRRPRKVNLCKKRSMGRWWRVQAAALRRLHKSLAFQVDSTSERRRQDQYAPQS